MTNQSIGGNAGKKVPVQAGGVAYRLIAGRHYLQGTRGTFELKGVGIDVWRAIDGRKSVADIIDSVSSEYGVDREVAAGDVQEFLENLDSFGLLEA